MNRMMKIALGAIMVGFALPVFAQDNFPDVSDNHWAYEAVENLKKAGILVGYPDGLYRGARPMSRYEYAAATNAAYQKMMSMHDDLSSQIAALKKMVEDMKPGDNSAMQKQLADMQAQIDGMKGWGARIGDLERMSKEFEKELASMGVNMKKMRQGPEELENRVGILEKIKPAVDIHGTLDFLALAGHSTDHKVGFTPDGRIVGVGLGGGTVGLTRDLTMLHEAAMTFKGTNEEGPKWEATVVAGNMVSGTFGMNALGNMNGGNSGNGFRAGSGDLYINTANVTFDTALVGQGMTAKIGRVGYQVGPYIWRRTDFTSYYRNERWDNGDYYFDGGILTFNWGKAGLTVFGGTNSSVTTNNGLALNPSSIDKGAFGSGMLDRTLGVNLEFPVGDMGSINLAYLWADSDTLSGDADLGTPGVQSADRRNTFGGQIDLKFDKFNIWGAYSQINLSKGTSNVMDTDNTAWDVRLNYDGGNWGGGAGYREVENNFLADGSWGRLGNVYSPRNIKGFMGQIWIKPSATTKLWAKGEFDEPKDTALGMALAQYDRIDKYIIGLDYALGTNWNAMLSYEDTQFRGAGLVGDDKLRWYTLGVNYGLGANSSLWFTYMFSDSAFSAGSVLDPLGPPGVGGRRYKGGLFGTQLSVKF